MTAKRAFQRVPILLRFEPDDIATLRAEAKLASLSINGLVVRVLRERFASPKIEPAYEADFDDEIPE